MLYSTQCAVIIICQRVWTDLGMIVIKELIFKSSMVLSQKLQLMAEVLPLSAVKVLML